MPELAEVARCVSFIEKNVINKKMVKVEAADDDMIFGKAGTTSAAFIKALSGRRITGAGQKGKYLWLVISEGPHVVMHFGMSGWFHIKGVDSHFDSADSTWSSEEWPPRFTKARLWFGGPGGATEAAFVDARRSGRIYLVPCAPGRIVDHRPLAETGPDPITNREVINEQWLAGKLYRKSVAIKQLLIDQTFISGFGNWMADEILYHSRIHPEQRCNTFSAEQIKELNWAIHYVCTTSVALLSKAASNAVLFPSDWLCHHRWGKRGSEPQQLPNGDTLIFMKIGGRTSAVVPDVQQVTDAEAVTPVRGRGGKRSSKPDFPVLNPNPASSPSPSPAQRKQDMSETTETDAQAARTSTASRGTKRSAQSKPAASSAKAKTRNTQASIDSSPNKTRRPRATTTKK